VEAQLITCFNAIPLCYWTWPMARTLSIVFVYR